MKSVAPVIKSDIKSCTSKSRINFANMHTRISSQRHHLNTQHRMKSSWNKKKKVVLIPWQYGVKCRLDQRSSSICRRYRSGCLVINRAAMRYRVLKRQLQHFCNPAKSSAFDRNSVESRRHLRAQETIAIGIFRRLHLIFIFSCPARFLPLDDAPSMRFTSRNAWKW